MKRSDVIDCIEDLVEDLQDWEMSSDEFNKELEVYRRILLRHAPNKNSELVINYIFNRLKGYPDKIVFLKADRIAMQKDLYRLRNDPSLGEWR